MQTDLVLGSWS